MKISIATLLMGIGVMALIVTALALVRFYPDVMRYIKLKSM